jgi:hypothetical protein
MECQCIICLAKREGLTPKQWTYKNWPIEFQIATDYPDWPHWKIEQEGQRLGSDLLQKRMSK